MKHLLYFYGDDCPHCQVMNNLADKLEKEEGISVDRIEVWNNRANEERMVQLDTEPCGGVPFFLNTITKKTICGEVSFKELKNWATGK